MPYARKDVYNQIFMFVSFAFNAVFIFGALITMNGFIISAVRNRKKKFSLANQKKYTKETRRQINIERQITVMLLLVSFLYLILIGPGFIHFVYWLVVPPDRDPLTFANFNLSYNVCQKLFFTNNSVNFFLYCISGKKFRSDLRSIFCSEKRKRSGNGKESTESGTQNGSGMGNESGPLTGTTSLTTF